MNGSRKSRFPENAVYPSAAVTSSVKIGKINQIDAFSMRLYAMYDTFMTTNILQYLAKSILNSSYVEFYCYVELRTTVL